MINIQNHLYVLWHSCFFGCFLNVIYVVHSSLALMFGLRKTCVRIRPFNVFNETKEHCFKRIFAIFWDILYFVSITPICAIFLFGVNSGILRWYIIFSVSIGFLIFKITFGRVINYFFELLICLLKFYLIYKIKGYLKILIVKLHRKGKIKQINKRKILISINGKQGN